MASIRRRPTGHAGASAFDDDAAAGSLQTVLQQLQEAAAVSEAELVALVERATVDAHDRRHPESAGRVRARFDPLASSVSLERVDEDGGVSPVPQEVELQRTAATAIRIAVAGLLRDAQRGRAMREGTARRGELVDAIVERQDGATWLLRVNELTAALSPEEQVPGEVLERAAHRKVVVLDVTSRGRDVVLRVSRSHPLLLRRLLEQEIPELTLGQIRIRALVREAGRRSKVAVESMSPAIDPEGACIGPRGVRHRAVVGELGGEQLHVIGWSDDPATLVARAVGPAAVLSVELDIDTRTARVVVPATQLSLAIGRSGENARLAARLSGWRIDIRGEEPAS